MRFIYSISIHVYSLLIQLAAIGGHRKARLWIHGRRSQKSEWRPSQDSDRWIWFHVSSLGEFEQGRPLIEYYRDKHPDIKILLTFFSPSGFEIRKNYSLADKVLYLPKDTPRNARRLLSAFQCKMVFFVKYDFWFNYMHELQRHNVPLFLISGIFRKKQHFYKWYGSWARKQLSAFSHFFVQNSESVHLLMQAGFTNITLCGDTRFDRVVKVANEAKAFPEIEHFIQQKPVYMAGSSWEPDERFIIQLIEQKKEIKFIIIPHEVDDERIDHLIEALPCKASLYSEKSKHGFNENQVLIINTIGMLSSLYRYATIAHIGNGFGSGIHNTLEAAVYGVPVIFGPNYHKFQEAKDLILCGGGFSFSTTEEYNLLCERLFENRDQASQAASTYVRSKAGATRIITQAIEKMLEF